MKRLLVTFILLLSFVSIACAAPKLSVESLNLDFGNIFQGEQVHHVFRFQNSGDEVLQIGNVRSSCGCTAALLSATRISPGDFGELQLTFDSTRFKGAIHKTVSIDSNDPDAAQLTFSMHGNVKAELMIAPERVKWGRVKVGTPLSATVTLKNMGKKTVKLNTPTVTNSVVSAEVSEQLLPPGGQVELRIKTTFPGQKKRLTGYVIVATDYPKVPQLQIPFSARLAK